MKYIRYIMVVVIFLIIIISTNPMSQAKFIHSDTYEFSVVTKTLNVEKRAFGYTGEIQNYTIPYSGYYVIQVWGADGGNSSQNNIGGLGDNYKVMSYFEKNLDLKLKIGGAGGNGIGSKGGAGGYNGGGSSLSEGWGAINSGGGGGGATSIYIGDKLALVSGGGGGAGSSNSGTNGGAVSMQSFISFDNGSFSGFYRPGLAGIGLNHAVGGEFSGQGATTVGGETFVISGFGTSQGKNGTVNAGGDGGNWGGGGGGGLYGGGGGSSNTSIAGGGGGGSSFYLDIFTDTIPVNVAEKLPTKEEFNDYPYKEKYGYAIITFVGGSMP